MKSLKSFRSFLISKWYNFIFMLVCMALLAGILSAVEVQTEVIELLVMTVAMLWVLPLLIEFFLDRSFWKALERALSENDSVFMHLDSLSQPVSDKNRIVKDTIDKINAEARAVISRNKEDRLAYREFIETWVHEVKTPLSAARLLLENHPFDESYKVVKELMQIEMYVDQSLYWARADNLERDYALVPTSLKSMVSYALRSHFYAIQEANMQINIHNLDVDVITDAKWCQFMIGQVLDNALKYRNLAKAQPTLEIFACSFEHSSFEKTVELHIKDNGIGIEKRDLKRVFAKGFVGANGRGALQEKSTGLGLYLIQKMALKMGIELEIDSEVGKWTEVVLRFSATHNK